MPTKRKARPAKKPITEKTRAADERLREELRNADMRTFTTGITKAFQSSGTGRAR